MMYSTDDKFRKRLYDFNQDIKILSPFYIISPDGDVFLFKENSFFKYNITGGLTAVMSKFIFHEDIKDYVLLDAQSIYQNMQVAKGFENVIYRDGVFLFINRVVDSTVNKIRIGKVVNMPENDESLKNVLSFKSKIESLYEELYWLDETELEKLYNDKFLSITSNARNLRLFRPAIVNMKKNDKVGVYLTEPNSSDIMNVFIVVQRPKCITAHHHKAVNWDS